MFVENVFLFLWSLTIIGFFIKQYSYRMVPYIIAENPNIKALDAIRLSRHMMEGHKWECFVADCSFLGWYLLNLVTFGSDRYLLLQWLQRRIFRRVLRVSAHVGQGQRH